MKKIKAIAAVVLVFSMLAGTASFARAGEAQQIGFTTSNSILSGRGIDIPALTTSTFGKFFNIFRMAVTVLTGQIFFTDGTFDAQFSDELSEFCRNIRENSCLDVERIICGLPDATVAGNLAYKVFKYDTEELRRELYEKRDAGFESGDSFSANFYWLIGAYLSGIQNAYVYLTPVEDEDYDEISIDVKYADGTTEIFHPRIYVNTETGECFGDKESGMMGIGFNCNVNELLVYAPMYCWMRDFGFCFEYDLLCYILPIYRYETRRFKFDYDGREWMVQAWKGNYLITNGGEVGCYYRDPGSFGSYYDVIDDEDRMPMTLQIRHGDEVLVNIPETLHWWVNGFKIAKTLYSPLNLTLESSIVFPNEEMRDAFCASVDKNIWHDVSYEKDGLRVSITW